MHRSNAMFINISISNVHYAQHHIVHSSKRPSRGGPCNKVIYRIQWCSGVERWSVSNHAIVLVTQRCLNFSGVGSQSITLELLHAVLLERASPVAMSVVFMSLNPAVLPMILKPITAVIYSGINVLFSWFVPIPAVITAVAITMSSSITNNLHMTF